MDGFKRPSRPPQSPVGQQLPPVQQPMPARHSAPVEQRSELPSVNGGVTEAQLPAIDMKLAEHPNVAVAKKRRKRWPFVVLGLVVLLAGAVVAANAWYRQQLTPVDTNNTTPQDIKIESGVTFSYVSDRLQERGIIRSSLAFQLFARLEGKQNALQEGTCRLTPSQTVAEILSRITSGCHDYKSITFYPGATLEPSLYAQTKAAQAGKPFKDPSIRASLRSAGYSDADISAAFAAQYNSPLFAGRPTGEGLEGYIFGETYHVEPNATAQEVLQVVFDYMAALVKTNNLVAKFSAQGLSLYQGITLASVVEKELDCEGKPTEERKNRCYGYQQQIARVFYNRIDLGMSLGSDVTSIYASDKLGVASSIDVDSPYNTRRFTGMPPGPIATPGKLALLAVANPSNGDELYFLAGDDGLLYFAQDETGHTANIRNHCQTLCGDL